MNILACMWISNEIKIIQYISKHCVVSCSPEACLPNLETWPRDSTHFPCSCVTSIIGRWMFKQRRLFIHTCFYRTLLSIQITSNVLSAINLSPPNVSFRPFHFGSKAIFSDCFLTFFIFCLSCMAQRWKNAGTITGTLMTANYMDHMMLNKLMLGQLSLYLRYV